MGKNIKKIVFSVLLFSLSFCQEDPRKIAEQELNKKMEPTRAELANYKSESIYWNGIESDKDNCIKKFLISINNKLAEPECLVDAREWKQSYLPYVLGTGTILDGTPLNEYLNITSQRKEMGLTKLYDLLGKKKISNIAIRWTKNTKNQYGPFNAWKPVISLSINRHVFVINEVKQLIEYKGTYKIAVIAP